MVWKILQLYLPDKTSGYTEDVDEYWSRLRRLNWKRLVMKEREDEKCDSHKQVNSICRICRTMISSDLLFTSKFKNVLQKMTEALRRSVRTLNFAHSLSLLPNMFNLSECSSCPKWIFHKKNTNGICSWVFQLDLPDYLVIFNLFWGNKFCFHKNQS